MTQALYLVTRAAGDEGSMIDGVFAVVINGVSTDPEATTLTNAVAQLNASKNVSAGGDDADILGPAPFPDNYFDTVSTLSDLAEGPLATNGSAAIFGGIGTDATVTVIA